MKKTAIILGATGLTGSILLEKLIADSRYEHIKLFSRSKIENLPNKVSQFIGNLLELDQFKSDFTANEVYCCIGTTSKKTPDKTLYKKIDYGIPVAAAKLAQDNNIQTFSVVSALGANPNSNVFYNKTKGEMERDVQKQNIKNTFIFRPSLIGGDRDEQRTLENIGLAIFKVIQPLFIGKLKQYKITEPEDIAQTMIDLSNTTNYNEVIITSNDIKSIAKNHK
ncbi:NAD(P)H-binding protein [Tamlana sp. s12]|uniref:NAD(P)H-binding protein n=1 Tax=Tamlana sp. s12 TaxID=1630406 RepID=UPI0008022DEB|nr:NAD(P)H-binding protein [Tamlana sp. s12]OBQ52511.1 nucleoside-diphosphate sugar epimerase [Tamlana sp. s12]QQY81455.1 NAD(P)H-binding protein [Tamlana sp. s12]